MITPTRIIYEVTEWSEVNKCTFTNLFLTITTLTEWLQQYTSEKKYHDVDKVLDLDLTAENLAETIIDARANGCAAMITLEQDLQIIRIKSTYTIAVREVYA